MSVLDDKISAGKGESSLLDYAQHLQNTYKTPAHVKFLADKLEAVVNLPVTFSLLGF